MIKKLIIAGSLAGSMLVGVPAANASPFRCMQDYSDAIATCAQNGQGVGSPCEMGAALMLADCMQREAVIHH